MASFIPEKTPSWDTMRKKRAKDWKKLLDKVLEAGRKSQARSLEDDDLSAAATARDNLRDDLETLVAEATGSRLAGVKDSATEVLLDLARAKGLHSSTQLACLTAAILARVKPLVRGSATLSKSAARIELKALVAGLTFGQKVLERLKAMKEAATGGEDPNLDVLAGELAGLIDDFKAAGVLS